MLEDAVFELAVCASRTEVVPRCLRPVTLGVGSGAVAGAGGKGGSSSSSSSAKSPYSSYPPQSSPSYEAAFASAQRFVFVRLTSSLKLGC